VLTNDVFEDVTRVIAHEAGHAVMAWSSPILPAPVAVRFWPLKDEAHVEFGGWPSPDLPGVHLEFAALFLAGFAGETVACGDFERLLMDDFGHVMEIVRLLRILDKLPRRRYRATPFRARLPHNLHRGAKTFLNDAFDLAMRRITEHHETFERLRAHLSRGYCVERRVEFLADELSTWLGPRPT
jgi:hypothetical protein